MNSRYKYSFIIPHRDIPQLLLRCLDSIPRREDVQIIVVDDVSSPEIVDKYFSDIEKDESVQLIKLEKSNGAGYARNVGLAQAHGEWIVFADADDFFEEGLLDKLDGHSSDAADIIYFRAKSVYSDSLQPSPKLDKRNQYLDGILGTSKVEAFCKYFCTEPWGKMIRRSLIENNSIRFDETPLANDYYFSVLTACNASRIQYDNTVLYVYTERKMSLSYKYSGNTTQLATRLSVYYRVQKYYDEHGIRYIPFYRLSLSEYRTGNDEFRNIIKSFWQEKGISVTYAWYRYIIGKIYASLFGITL